VRQQSDGVGLQRRLRERQRVRGALRVTRWRGLHTARGGHCRALHAPSLNASYAIVANPHARRTPRHSRCCTVLVPYWRVQMSNREHDSGPLGYTTLRVAWLPHRWLGDGIQRCMWMLRRSAMLLVSSLRRAAHFTLLHGALSEVRSA